MSYTLPSDEALSDRYREVYFSTTGNHRDAAIAALHAVARLAIEHFIAESVKASGVDVEALARAACERCRSDGPAIGCGGCKRIASALRTAVARAVAQRDAEIASLRTTLSMYVAERGRRP